ncbi:DSBA-like thioredoxin domain-containing protein [Hyaloraphidium curvatum]|nr:DSBA-like thioredoxin domain-containing protein [Hyaloraphidium curvatum]
MATKSNKLTLFFDCVSPYSWLAFEVCGRYEPVWPDVEFEYIPVFLGGINHATGNKPPGSLPAKARYNQHDMARLKAFFDVPIMDQSPSKFPVVSLKAQRLLVALRERDKDNTRMKKAARAIWTEFWGRDRNLEEDGTLKDALQAAGIADKEIGELMQLAGTAAVKEKLNANTALAVDKRAFGAPWLWAQKTDANGQRVEAFFFGNDRWEVVALFLQENWIGPVPGRKPVFRDHAIIGYLGTDMQLSSKL